MHRRFDGSPKRCRGPHDSHASSWVVTLFPPSFHRLLYRYGAAPSRLNAYAAGFGRYRSITRVCARSRHDDWITAAVLGCAGESAVGGEGMAAGRVRRGLVPAREHRAESAVLRVNLDTEDMKSNGLLDLPEARE